MKKEDLTENWESSFIEGLTGSIKFPVTFHDTQQLNDLSELQEKVSYKQPKKKLNTFEVVKIGKAQKNKNGKNNLF